MLVAAAVALFTAWGYPPGEPEAVLRLRRAHLTHQTALAHYKTACALQEAARDWAADNGHAINPVWSAWQSERVSFWGAAADALDPDLDPWVRQAAWCRLRDGFQVFWGHTPAPVPERWLTD